MSRCWFLILMSAVSLGGQGLPITYQRLLKADQEPGNWLMYSTPTIAGAIAAWIRSMFRP